MKNTWKITPGSQLAYDGEMCTVAEIGDGAVIVRTADGRTRRLRMIDVLRPVSEGGKTHVPGRRRDDEESKNTSRRRKAARRPKAAKATR